MFEQPGLTKRHPLDNAIDLVDENALPPHHKQYRLSMNELDVM